MSNDKYIEIGTRITVYFDELGQWYKGTVVDKDPDDDERYLVHYDDGDEFWMDVSTDRYRKSTKPDKFIKVNTLESEKVAERIAKLNRGSRISVYWPMEKEYFTGTITKIKRVEEKRNQGSLNSNDKRHFIEYDDGDKEWLNLNHREFKIVRQKVLRLHVGHIVSVWDESHKKYFKGKVIEIQPTQAKPHNIQYDDASKGCEWVNLNVLPFLDLQNGAQSDPDISTQVNAMTLDRKKRKHEFFTPDDPNEKENPRERKRREEEEERKKAKLICNEICCICKNTSKRTRATSCHHIFCKPCIMNAFEESVCPICKADVESKLIKYDHDHEAFKPVEALDRKTTEVLLSYSSASAASLDQARFKPFRIVECCLSKRRDDREYLGYYWRFKGSKDRILRAGEAINEGIPIEQLDLTTNEVIKVFRSSRQAYEETGVSRCSIKRVLERRGKANAGGYFWRFQGETHEPWPDPEATNLNPVEKLDFETGDLLKSFISLAEAKREMGMRPNRACIREVCDGKGRASAQGYFWRWKGSKALPNHLMGVQKVIQIRKTPNGNVFKEFRTSKDAQAFFGYQKCWSTLCNYAREKGIYKGYHFQYKMIKSPQREEESIIGKRLRVKNPENCNSDWIDGQIHSYDTKTGKHEIIYDNDTAVHVYLKDLDYEWKNDQGQKAIEKLDLETGEVLESFNSISDAAASIPGASTTRLTAVCKGRYQSSSGFFWRYKGSQNFPTKSKPKKRVEQLCLQTGNVLATFDSIVAAGKAVGITTPGISYCCNGRNNSKSAGGFGWRFTIEI